MEVRALKNTDPVGRESLPVVTPQTRGGPVAEEDGLGKELQRWCNAMLRTYTGKVALANIIHDCTRRRVPAKYLRRFFKTVEQDWRRKSVGDAAEVLIGEISRRKRLHAKGIRRIGATYRCSRIVSAKDLLSENIDLRKKGWRITSTVPHRYIEHLERGLGALPQGSIPNSKPYAWVTQSSAVDEVRRRYKRSTARVVCRKLGLLHFAAYGEASLLEVVYPDAVFMGTKAVLRPPTFLDGSPYIVYRSKCNSDGWGRAVDLVNGTDGLPEAVHTPIPFTAKFTIRNLGHVDGVSVSIRWRTLLKNAPRPWHADDLKILEGFLP